MSIKKKLKFDISSLFNNNEVGQVKRFGKWYDIINELIYKKMIIKKTQRFLDNGDVFVFFEIKNPIKSHIHINFNKSFNGTTFDDLYIKPEFDNRYGENKISGPSFYIKAENIYCIISKLYYYKELITTYDSENYSSLLELKSEENTIKIDKNELVLDINCLSENCSFFLLLSKEKLFNDEKYIKEYFDHYFNNIRQNFVASSYFILPSGTYTKLPYSIEPFTKNGYGFSLHHSSKKELIPFLENGKGRIFYNLIVNAIIQAFLYQKNDNGIFYTPYTSTWLKKETGITSFYIDTRLNETYNLMLKDFIRICPDTEIMDNTKKYMDFLVMYANSNDNSKLYVSKKGVFLPDYFKDGLEKITHASLNHQLGIANSMAQMFYTSDDLKYKNIFDKIIFFIEDTVECWVNTKTNDLYYGIQNKNGDTNYFGNDYIYVTFIDLLRMQEIYINIYNEKNKSITFLINKKLEWLILNGYSIFDENAKEAAGELKSYRNEALSLYLKLYSS